MGISDFAIEQYVSKQAVAVKACGATEVADDFPSRSNWLSDLAMNAIFLDAYDQTRRGLAIQMVRRLDSSLSYYSAARSHVLALVARERSAYRSYFAALDAFEASVSHLYQAIQASGKVLGKKYFLTNDGSAYQRLNQLYNTFRHAAAEDEPPIWFDDVGLACDSAKLSFPEYEALLSLWARTADQLAKGKP